MKMKAQFSMRKNALPRLGPAARAAAAKVVRDTAADVATLAQSLAPERTGRLKAGIKPVDTADPLVWEVVSEAPYSGFVELGTYKMDAQPFFIPAIEAVETTFPGRIKTELGSALKRAAG